MTIVAAISGLLVGIVLNALADSLPPDEFGARRPPRPPRCAYCGRAHWPPLWSAVAAFLLWRGQCEHCGAPRRLRALLVELASAVGFAYLAARYGLTAQFAFSAYVVAVMILVTVTDLEHRLILRAVVYPAAGLALLAGGLVNGWSKTLAGGAAGFGLVYVMYWLGWAFGAAIARLRGRPLEAAPLGGGDVNLAGFVGLAVGWPGVLLGLLIAVLAGGAGGLVYMIVMLIRRRYTPFSAIPYGPFLALGGLAVLIWGQELAAWYLRR